MTSEFPFYKLTIGLESGRHNPLDFKSFLALLIRN
jgi:hypothetical protein